MPGPFESATRVAIEEMIEARASKSKFGYILTEESFRELTNDLYNLLLTSRSLKSAGDRLLQTAIGQREVSTGRRTSS